MKPATADPKALVLGTVKELPPLPLVVHELTAVMRNPNCSADDITRVISSDQALASKILRLVNSSFYGVPGGVGTISRAVIILGHASLRSLATGLSVAGAIGKSIPTARRRQFWQHALTVAAGAEVIARECGMPEPEDAFVAGLLHDIGHVVLMVALPEGYAEALGEDGLGCTESERARIGLDHCRAGRYLLQHWKIPGHLLEVVRSHHAADASRGEATPLLTIVALADRLARIQGNAVETPDTGADAIQLMDRLHIEPTRVIAMLADIGARLSVAQDFIRAAELETELEDCPSSPGRRSVVLSGDNRRSDWLKGLAAHHGDELVSAQDFLSDIASAAVDTVICDLPALTEGHQKRLGPLLLPARGSVRLVGPLPSGATGLFPEARPLPLVFSAADLHS